MPAIRFTLPYDEKKTAILKKEAKRRKRSFSNYMQTLFVDHLNNIIPVESVKKKKRKRKR